MNSVSKVVLSRLDFLVVLAAALVVGCAETGAVRGPSGGWVDCVPRFSYSQGWLGGDAAFSVPLSRARGDASKPTLWLFGDSFVAARTQSNRDGAAFVHNSIGLSRCSAQDGFAIDYFWGRDAGGAFDAFFSTGEGSHYWWLFSGFVHAGALYVGLLELEESLPDEVLQLPIRMTGMKLARIANPHDAPAAWTIELATLSDSEEAFPGASMVVDGDHVYFFSFTQLREGRQPRFLARMPLRALARFPDDLTSEVETWTRDLVWERGFLPERARMLMDDNASEMSVEYHEELGRWLAVYGSPIQVDPEAPARTPASMPHESDRIYLRSAERLEGPWSRRREIHRIEELAPGRSETDPNTFCYAAKAHLDFSPEDALLVTYVCNLMTRPGEDPWPILQRLVLDMRIYRPRSVVVPLPDGLVAESTTSAP